MPKQSTIRKPEAKVRFSNGRPSCFWPPSSLDRFVMNKIFFMTGLGSPFEIWTQMSGFQMVRISNGRYWHKIEFDKTGQSGIRMPTVFRCSL